MKKVVLMFAFSSLALMGTAQKMMDLTLDLIGRNFDKAKDKIIAMEAGGKFAKNADFYAAKGATYDSIANNPKFKGLVADAGEVAMEAYKKAISLNPKQVDLMNSKYWPFFGAYLKENDRASNLFNVGKYCESAEAFKKSGEIATYIAKNKWEYAYKDNDGKDAILKTLEFDADNTFNIALCYTKCPKLDEANNYMQILADKKLKGKDYDQSVYNNIIGYHVQKGNIDLADKYTILAKEVYPEADFFDDAALDLFRKKKDFNALFAQYDKIIATSPKNIRVLKNYCIEQNNYVYEGVDPAKNELAVDYDARVVKAKEVNEKGIAATDENAFFLYMNGQLHNNLGYDIIAKAKQIKFTIDPKTKKPKPLAPEMAKKREALKKQADAAYGVALNNLLEAEKKYNALKVANKFVKGDKQSFSSALNLLSQIYEYKGQADKVTEYNTKYRATLN